MSCRRIRDYGISIGSFPTGERNSIGDIPGVSVGHCTIDTERHKTGVTVILPCEDNIFAKKLAAASYVLNGFGKTAGTIQINELGTLESPIALTNTLNVGLVHDALVSYIVNRCRSYAEFGITRTMPKKILYRSFANVRLKSLNSSV